ncbi:MAG: hypothetical protein WCR56_01415 [Bacilli bacterium]|jgi:hypothetical protein
MQKCRVVRYADLRKKISNMDVYSFQESQSQKRNLPSSKPVHQKASEASITNDVTNYVPGVVNKGDNNVNKDGIKRNTLSLSIDELIKEYDTYDSTTQKKEAKAKYQKKVKEEKKSHHQGFSLATLVWALIGLIMAGIVALIVLVIIGVI